MMTENLEKQIEKQIGCMSGFLHIFDRQQILAGKRIYSTKRLPPSNGVPASPESVKSVKSPAIREIEKPELAEPVVSVPSTPDRFQLSPAKKSNVYTTATPPKSPLPFPLFEIKEGTMKNSWKFCKEMPRLSLDSRATVDSKGSLCPKEGANSRSPSVIARLMGLEQLPSIGSEPSRETTVNKPELRRSASESRVSKDLFHSRFIDANNVQAKQPNETSLINKKFRDNAGNRNNTQNGRVMESKKYPIRNQKNESQWKSPSRSFFNSADFFPEPNQTTMQMYSDSEKHLKMRGIDQQSNDLETLKHILEALQLKGLLHSKRPLYRDSQRNFVYAESKPEQLPVSNRRYSGDSLPSVSPRKERGVIDRSGRSPVRARIQSHLRNSTTIVKKKPLSIETRTNYHDSSESRRSSPINSPKLTPNRSRSGSDYQSVTNRSPRNRKPTDMQKVSTYFLAEDESSSISESSGSTNSQSDPERTKMEEYREGKSLLARCDKLLHSIAEMNSITTESHMSSNSVIPSPVSVLDSVFDKDESSSPSPVMKRSIDFKDLTIDLEDDIWTSITSPETSTGDEEYISEDSDLTYISEILRASKYLPDDSSVFFSLEKRKCNYGNDASKSSKLQRKLVFDVVGEIIDRNGELPPWKAIWLTESGSSVKQICSEFQKIREPETAENLLDLICTVLKKDLAGNNGWGDHPVETSEAVLYIERLIFKDLISESILDLAELAGKTTFLAPRRKLFF